MREREREGERVGERERERGREREVSNYFLSNILRSMLSNPKFDIEKLYDIIKEKDKTNQKLAVLLNEKEAKVNKFVNSLYSLNQLVAKFKADAGIEKLKKGLPADVKPNGYAVDMATLLDVTAIVLTGVCDFINN